MNSSPTRPLLGLILAIAITTAMDANGLGMFSALPLWPLGGLFWYLQRFSRRDMGLTRGTRNAYFWALAYPVLVMGPLVAAAHFAGQTSPTDVQWSKEGLQVLIGSTVGVLILILTEEGFFRGWLWASLARTGAGEDRVLLLSTLGFVVWHLSAVTIMPEYRLPLHQIPVYLVNATLLGLIWGVLRRNGRSIVPAAVSHAVWNPLAYGLFGMGEASGALGISSTIIWGPERGVLGIVANTVFLFVLLRRGRRG